MIHASIPKADMLLSSPIAAHRAAAEGDRRVSGPLTLRYYFYRERPSVVVSVRHGYAAGVISSVIIRVSRRGARAGGPAGKKNGMRAGPSLDHMRFC